MQSPVDHRRVDINGDDAPGRDTRWSVGGGMYSDTYRREHGIWRIASWHVVRPFDLAQLANSDGRLDLGDIVALAGADQTENDT